MLEEAPYRVLQRIGDMIVEPRTRILQRYPVRDPGRRRTA